MDLHIINCKVNKYNVTVIADDEFVGYTARTTGRFWEDWISDDIKQYYKPGTDILDIGANIGTHALMFSEIGPVHAFEPVYHPIVKLNVENNDLKNPIKIYPFALSDVDKTVDIYIPMKTKYGAVNYGGTSIHPDKISLHGDETPYKCDCHRLDDVYDGVPSIIKMDVERHELYVLKGAVNTISKHKPVIYAEICNPETSEVTKFIKSLGYNNPIVKNQDLCIFTHASTDHPQTQS